MNRRTSFWPLFVLGIAATSLTGAAILIFFAHTDRAFVAEPDYYAKAVAWNDTARQHAANERLGWSLCLDAAPLIRPGEPVTFIAALRARDGTPISGAALQCEAFHRADPAHRLTPTVRVLPAGGGRAVLALPVHRPGLWVLRFTATRGSDTFTTECVHDIRTLQDTIEHPRKATP
ncbi:MAG TPA: hypothetical protein DEB06_08645 [Phycisphaerales bacterium]|nr:hypothetical protein [Phycisphaerales bacterium]